MATPNYSVNYDDKRFTEVEADKKAALNEVDVTYGNMIGQSDKYFQAQIDASKDWADKQSQIQQENTDFAIEQIEQQKGQAQKDYTKEQSGAYVDWQKQSNEYGANAEQMASAGLAGSGFSESSQVSMYNTYQNRVATAREAYQKAVLNYDNAIKDARLQNNAALAEIAYQALQQQLELSLEGFQYKNQLLIEQSNKKLEVDNMYYNRYQDVLNQINTENALAEEVRQYNQDYQLRVDALEEEIRQYNQDYNLKIDEYNEGIRQFNEEIARLKEKDAKEYETEIEKLKIQKQSLEEEKRQFDEAAKEEKRQFNLQLAEEKRQYNLSRTGINKGGTISGKGGGSSGKGGSRGYTDTGTGGKVTPPASSNTPSGSSGSIDMASVLALGYGPISAARLNELEKQGLVESYKKNGKTYFRKTSYVYKNEKLFGGK